MATRCARFDCAQSKTPNPTLAELAEASLSAAQTCALSAVNETRIGIPAWPQSCPGKTLEAILSALCCSICGQRRFAELRVLDSVIPSNDHCCPGKLLHLETQPPVTPANAGAHLDLPGKRKSARSNWIPSFDGMTLSRIPRRAKRLFPASGSGCAGYSSRLTLVEPD